MATSWQDCGGWLGQNESWERTNKAETSTKRRRTPASGAGNKRLPIKKTSCIHNSSGASSVFLFSRAPNYWGLKITKQRVTWKTFQTRFGLVNSLLSRWKCSFLSVTKARNCNEGTRYFWCAREELKIKNQYLAPFDISFYVLVMI